MLPQLAATVRQDNRAVRRPLLTLAIAGFVGGVLIAAMVTMIRDPQKNATALAVRQQISAGGPALLTLTVACCLGWMRHRRWIETRTQLEWNRNELLWGGRYVFVEYECGRLVRVRLDDGLLRHRAALRRRQPRVKSDRRSDRTERSHEQAGNCRSVPRKRESSSF